MLKIWTTSIVAALGMLLFSTFVEASPATGDCNTLATRPPSLPLELQSREPAEVMAACVSDDGERVQFIAVAFDGPSGGLLFPVDRAGIPLSGIAIGRPRSIELTRLQSGIVVLIVRTTIGTGTGVREDEFSLYRVDSVQPKQIWRGLALYRDIPPTGRGSVRTGAISITENLTEKSVLVDHVVIERRVTITSRGKLLDGKPRTTHSESRVMLN